MRSAIVVERLTGPSPGFVFAGRSLREIEKRESLVLAQVMLGWLFTLAATLMATATTTIFLAKSQPKT